MLMDADERHDEQPARAGRASGKPPMREIDAAVLAALVGELRRRRLARWVGRSDGRGPDRGGEHLAVPGETVDGVVTPDASDGPGPLPVGGPE